MNQYTNPYFSLRRKLIYEALEKYPNHGSRTLAKLVYSQHPEYFNHVEHARCIIRLYRGSSGKRDRIKLTNQKYYKDVKPV